jgi:UPF0042 nucleotide-binding protein
VYIADQLAKRFRQDSKHTVNVRHRELKINGTNS